MTCRQTYCTLHVKFDLFSMAHMLRHEIIAEFRTEQLSLDPAAIKLLQTRIEESNAGRDMVMAVVAAVKEAMGSAGMPSEVCNQVTTDLS